MDPWVHGPWYQVLSTKYKYQVHVLSTKYQVLGTEAYIGRGRAGLENCVPEAGGTGWRDPGGTRPGNR